MNRNEKENIIMNNNSTKTDSRVIRSKRDLANALEELLQEKNLDDISITEITKRALVSKNTFYNNFVEKSDLLTFLFQRYALLVQSQLDKIIEQYPDDLKKAFYECDKAIVHFFYSSSFSFERIVQNDKSKVLYWAVNDFINSVISDLFRKYPVIQKKNVPLDILCTLYSGAASNLIYYMYSKNNSIKEEECVQYMYDLLLKTMID